MTTKYTADQLRAYGEAVRAGAVGYAAKIGATYAQTGNGERAPT